MNAMRLPCRVGPVVSVIKNCIFFRAAWDFRIVSHGGDVSIRPLFSASASRCGWLMIYFSISAVKGLAAGSTIVVVDGPSENQAAVGRLLWDGVFQNLLFTWIRIQSPRPLSPIAAACFGQKHGTGRDHLPCSWWMWGRGGTVSSGGLLRAGSWFGLGPGPIFNPHRAWRLQAYHIHDAGTGLLVEHFDGLFFGTKKPTDQKPTFPQKGNHNGKKTSNSIALGPGHYTGVGIGLSYGRDGVPPRALLASGVESGAAALPRRGEAPPAEEGDDPGAPRRKTC